MTTIDMYKYKAFRLGSRERHSLTFLGKKIKEFPKKCPTLLVGQDSGFLDNSHHLFDRALNRGGARVDNGRIRWDDEWMRSPHAVASISFGDLVQDDCIWHDTVLFCKIM